MAVVGGLIMGTILSLFDIPIMHTYVDDFIRWVNTTFLGREWTWPVDEDETPHDSLTQELK
jgi:HAE1 family hydrophobic/amphiphilic exporter-1